MSSRTITFQLEPADYLAANRLHVRQQLRRPLYIVSFLCILAAYLVFAFMTWHPPPPTFVDIIVHFGALGLLLAPIINYFWTLPRQSNKIFQEQKGFHYPLTYSWSETGLEIDNQQGHVALPWSDLFKWTEDKSMILLYHSSRIFHMAPRRVVSDAQWDDFRQCIKTPKM